MVYDEKPGFFHSDVIQLLNDLQDRKIPWCTNSGRELEDQLAILEASRKRGLRHMPEALLCAECFIYDRDGEKFVSHEPWNTKAHRALCELNVHVQAVMKHQKERILREYENATAYFRDILTAFSVSEQNGQALRLFHEMRSLLAHIPSCEVIRNGTWVAVNRSEYGKGNVLSGYLKKRGTQGERVLAIGDQQNDLVMLDGTVAKWVGCPGDSISEIKTLVKKAGGYVAQAHGPLGTTEVIRYFLDARS